jgi:signal transduction histidine kinase
VEPLAPSGLQDPRVGMRLASKIFAASTLVILALVGVAGWSLLAVDRLVRAHRDITDQSLPALQLEVTLQEAVPRLLRLEARYLVLRDRAYGDALVERVDRAATDLGRLDGLLKSTAELAIYRDAVARAQAAVRALESRTWTTVLVALGVSVLVAVGAVGLVAFRLTRSVRQLSVATGRVADGSFNEPLPIETRDEIGDLTQSFNRMAEQLREVEALKEYFFAQVSHELRNPLTAIRASTQLLQERTRHVLDATQRHWLELIDESVDRLLALVTRILDFNRLRAGVFPLERHSIALDKVVARALDALRPQAEKAGLFLEQICTGMDFMLTADEEALTQVVFNLVGNAIKFTPDGGFVYVGVTDAGSHVELTVRDTGPGIPTADLARIFEPYQQAHAGRKGAGLGLAIVKELVAAHGGTTSIESEDGKGTCFTVRVPKATPPA